MPAVYVTTSTVKPVPAQRVLVGVVVDPTLVCSKVEMNRDGSTATFRSLVLLMDSDKRAYLTSPVIVEADGVIIFRGYFDLALSELRRESVTLTARSVLPILRERNLFVPEAYSAYNPDDVKQSAAKPPQITIPALDPYRFPDTLPLNLQPWEILGYFGMNNLDAWWRSQISIMFDPSFKPFEWDTVARLAWEWNETTKRVELTKRNAYAPAFPDQTFRLSTWGELLDYFGEMLPGMVVDEVFLPTHTLLYITTVGRAGLATATVGNGFGDIRTTGATVTDLELETTNADAVNRVVAFGGKVRCTASILSEDGQMVVEGSVWRPQLIPDWPMFDDQLPTELATDYPIWGRATMGDDKTVPYDRATAAPRTTRKQRVSAVMLNQRISDPGDPAFRDGYEDVGKKWRLPRSFAACEILTDTDFFKNPATGDSVGWQAFVELAVPYEYPDPDTPATRLKGFAYRWHWVQDAAFDAKAQTLTFKEAYFTPVITGAPLGGHGTALTEGEFKLARVALTFTFAHPNHALCSDTFLTCGGVIDPTVQTAIPTGQAYVFERPEMVWSQLSTLGFDVPIRARIVSATDGVTGSPDYRMAEEAITGDSIFNGGYLRLDQLLMYAAGSGGGGVRARLHSGPAEGVDPRTQVEREIQATDDIILRNDTGALYRTAWQVWATKCRRPRAFKVSLVYLHPGLRRGQMVMLENLRNYTGDGDYVESFEHNLETGETAFLTTNQPSDSTVRSLATVSVGG